MFMRSRICMYIYIYICVYVCMCAAMCRSHSRLTATPRIAYIRHNSCHEIVRMSQRARNHIHTLSSHSRMATSPHISWRLTASAPPRAHTSWNNLRGHVCGMLCVSSLFAHTFSRFNSSFTCNGSSEQCSSQSLAPIICP
jgi:hypothetical protein